MERTRTIPPQLPKPNTYYNSLPFFKLKKDAVVVFGNIPAQLLTLYTDKRDFFMSRHIINDGWFYFTQDKVESELNIGITTIRRCKKFLIQIGVISSEMRGSPPKEQLYIHEDSLELFLRNPEELTSVINRLHISNNRFNEIESENELNYIPDPPVHTTLKQRNEQYLPLAKYLAEIIQTTKRVRYDMITLKKWTNDIRMLIERNGVDIVRVRKALHWYKENVGREYVPVIEGGVSLKNKFPKLEAAMERESKPPIKKYSNKPERIMDGGDWYYLSADGHYYNTDDPKCPQRLQNEPV